MYQYRNVLIQGNDSKGYHYLLILNGNTSDVIGKRGRILDVAYFQSLRKLTVYLLKLHNGEPLYETIGRTGTSGLCG